MDKKITKKFTKQEMTVIVQAMVQKYRNMMLEAGMPMVDLKEVGVSTRCTRRFGLCRSHFETVLGQRTRTYCKIVISDLCFYNTVNCLRDTILHELVHTVRGCNNHRSEFHWRAKQVMELVPGSRIDTYCSEEESEMLGEYLKETGKKRHKSSKRYEVTCECCGHHFIYKKQTKLVKALLENRKHGYRHTSCGGKKFSIKVLA
jgi:hypothetical protein